MSLNIPITVLNDFLATVIDKLPNIGAAIILLIIGWVLGKVIGTTIKGILKKVKMDSYFKISKEVKFSALISVIISWVIYLVFIQSAVDVLGITSLIVFFGKVVSLITGLLGGIVIITIGYLIAKYVQKEIEDSKKEYSKLLGQVIFLFTLVISTSMAFKVTNVIPTDLIDNIILIVVGTIGLGVAIAIGLGLKDTIQKVAKKYEKKL